MTPPTWKPEDLAWRRVLAAVTSPPIAGSVVFACAVLAAVMLIVLRPHDLPVAPPDQPVDDIFITDAEDAMAVASVVFVHVSGEVREPGVVELTSGARVEAAIAAAGGVTDDARLDTVNLARQVIDGEQIVVPHTDDPSVDPAATRGSTSDGRVNLNHADATALESLPRIGPALASRIIDWRETNGGFTRVEDLMQVSGIGQKVFDELSDLVVAP